MHQIRDGESLHDQMVVVYGTYTMLLVLFAIFEPAPKWKSIPCMQTARSHCAATFDIEGVSFDLLTFLTGDMQSCAQLQVPMGSDGGRLGCQYLLPACCALGLTCAKPVYSVRMSSKLTYMCLDVV